MAICAGAAKLLGGLQQFKIKYAEARAKEHPELQQVYADKIAAMKAAGGVSGSMGHAGPGVLA